MRERFRLFTLLLVVFSSALGFGLVIPFLVVLVQRFGGNPFVFGLVGAVYPAMTVIGAPLLGRWSDRYGRRPVLLISQFGTLLGWCIFLLGLYLPITSLFRFGALVITLPLTVITFGRAIDGITGGNTSTAQAYLADITREKDRSKSFGYMSLVTNLGFIGGPALAGILSSTFLGEKLPTMLAVGISLVTFLLIFFLLPESHPPAKGQAEPVVSFFTVLHRRDIFFLLLLYFVMYVGYNIFYTAFPLYAIGPLHWTVAEMGIYFSVLSLFMAVVQGPGLYFITKRVNDIVLILFGTLILGTNFALLVSHTIAVLYIAALCFALGNGLMWPSFLSLISRVAGEKMQGSVQGLSLGVSGIASIIGLIGGGAFYSKFAGFTFFISAGIFYMVLLFSNRLIRLDKECRMRSRSSR